MSRTTFILLPPCTRNRSTCLNNRLRQQHQGRRQRIIWSEPVAGTASVIDGDTLEIHGTRISLYGVARHAVSTQPRIASHPPRLAVRAGTFYLGITQTGARFFSKI